MSELSPRMTAIAGRAEEAREKPAPLGPDIDLNRYRSTEPGKSGTRSPVKGPVRAAALEAGVDLSAKSRAATYLQVDRDILCSRVGKEGEGLVEVSPIAAALARHPWLEECWWNLVDADTDKYTSLVASGPPEGYFIRILPGAKIGTPLQSCLMVAKDRSAQRVHNIIVAEEGSEAEIITGCTVNRSASAGLHAGVSEFYVRKGASLTFSMIHNWSEGFHVRPRSAAVVEEGATFVSNYIVTRPVRSLQMYPRTVLRGKNSRSRFQAILLGSGRSLLDIGSRTVLEGKGSRSESVSRAIGADRSTIVARGELTARSQECRGHLECRGMLLSRGARIRAVPELQAEGVPRAELSHEAAISPIAEEEVAYLMSRGLTREEAVSTITRGFLNVDLPGLPPLLKESVDRFLSSAALDGL
jgi:Fe-S cluster assembly scaffold protein SufB